MEAAVRSRDNPAARQGKARQDNVHTVNLHTRPTPRAGGNKALLAPIFALLGCLPSRCPESRIIQEE